MLPCSVRRVAATAPQTPVLLANFSSSIQPPRTAATAIALSHRRSQNRRYSSSKPSRDNGAEGLPVGGRSAQQPSEAKAGESTKASGDKRKRKAKDAAEKQKYPSVPSTSHISPDFLALSSFFSLHRPVSITRGLPRNVTNDHFAAIFTTPAAASARGAKASEVMTTISRTVEELERPMLKYKVQQGASGEEHHNNNNNHHGGEGARHGIEFRVPADDAAVSEDLIKANITTEVNAMSGQFLPFRPPPLPVPQSETLSPASEENNAMAEEAPQPQTRTYKAMFTIEESTDTSGKVNIVAHSPKLIPRAFLDRMMLRQVQYEDAQVKRGTMVAISVKRQRRLKMKKHKYKKLMKKQRHERLKHGRT